VGNEHSTGDTHPFRVQMNILTLKLKSYAYKNGGKKHTVAYTHKGGLGSK